MRIWVLLLLIYFCRPSHSIIECELKDDENNKFSFSEHLLNNLKYARNNTKESMKHLECFCLNEEDNQSELFSDPLISEIQKVTSNWFAAQNLVIRDCQSLTIVLRNGQINFVRYFTGGILHFLNIKQLIIDEFTEGSNELNYAGIVFRHVNFERSIKQLTFNDMIEVRLNNISVSQNIKNVEIKMTNNGEGSIEPQLIVENSDFRTGNLGTRDTPFYFTVTNNQLMKNQCLAQRGQFRISNNYFDNFADDTVMMTRGSEFEFNRNKIEFIQKKSFQLKNIRKISFINNFLGVPQMDAIQIMYLQQPNTCRLKMNPIDEIEQITFNNNKMSKSSIDFVNVNIEGNPKPPKIMKKFQINNNDILVPCNCQSLNKEKNKSSSVLDLIAMQFTRSSQCFSNDGLVGKRSSICSGDEPPKPEEIIERKETEVKSQYVTYIIVGTIVGFTIGAILGAGILYMCMGDKGSITPRDSPMR